MAIDQESPGQAWNEWLVVCRTGQQRQLRHILDIEPLIAADILCRRDRAPGVVRRGAFRGGGGLAEHERSHRS